MKLENKIRIAVAMCFLAAGAAISALKVTVNSGILSGIFAVGLSMLFVSLYKHFKYGEGIEEDERTKKITARAITFSWFATLILITVMMQAEWFKISLDVRGALSIVFFSMIFTFSAFQWYFGRKGNA